MVSYGKTKEGRWALSVLSASFVKKVNRSGLVLARAYRYSILSTVLAMPSKVAT
jgi:hypothetical protein